MVNQNQEEIKRRREKALEILNEWEKKLEMECWDSPQKVKLKEEKEIKSKNKIFIVDVKEV